MRKTKKLLLNRETLRHLAAPWEDLREVAGGVKTIPISICDQTCPKLCNPSGPPLCTLHVVCGQ